MITYTEKDKERVLSYIEDNAEGCRPWTGYIAPNGYGMIAIGGKSHTAHRVVYQMFVGEIPEGMQIHHLCHWEDQSCDKKGDCPHRACCNIEHLRAVSPLENLMEGHTIVQFNATKTHCIRGHELTPDNVRLSPSHGWRYCKICDKIRADEHIDRRQALIEEGAVEINPKNLRGKLCIHGHDLEDSFIDKRGYPQCRECQRIRDTKRREDKRAAIIAAGGEIRRGPKLKTHCAQGHELTAANRRNDGRCRTCSNIRTSEFHKRKRREAKGL